MSNNYNWSQQYYPYGYAQVSAYGYTQVSGKIQPIRKDANYYAQSYHQHHNNYKESGYEQYGRRQNNYSRNKKNNHYHDDERNTQRHSRDYGNIYQQNYQNNSKPSDSNNKIFSNEDSAEHIPFFGPGQHIPPKKQFNIQSWQGQQMYKNANKYKNHIEQEDHMSYSSFQGHDPHEISKSIKESEDQQKYLGVESFYSVENNQTIGYGQVGRLAGLYNPAKNKKNAETKVSPPQPMPKNRSNIEQYSKQLDVEQKVQISDSKVCPFNESHRMPEKRLLTHIERCKHSSSARGFVNCPFDPLHWERADQIEAHKLICPQRVMGISNPDWENIIFQSHKQQQIKIIDNELEKEVKRQAGNNMIEDLREEEYERKVGPKKKQYEDWIVNGEF